MSRSSESTSRWSGAAAGLAAAVLFGASAPVAKLLLPGFGPVALAGVLYLSAGLALTAYRWGTGRVQPRRAREAPLRRADVPALVAIVLLGGALGPVLMLVGLQRGSAMAASLLLNLEAPFTILIAAAIFREYLGRRAGASAAAIVLGAGLLGWGAGPFHASWGGVLALAGACVCWAVDNNLTQRLSLRDPVALVQVKTLGAGALNILVAIATHQHIPAAAAVLAAAGLGALSYGLSVLLDAYALRSLGAAREAAYFATAPFIGAVVAVPLLGERPTPALLLAGAAMLAGVLLLLTEHHSHMHRHQEIEHEHLHVHDEHHQHAHEGPVTEPHSHLHQHTPLTHDHPHVPDLHHRHKHQAGPSH
jgi:drug/metabolite transporter (DMT)-like permease